MKYSILTENGVKPLTKIEHDEYIRNERIERTKIEAWACLKDLGVDMSYDEFLQWLELNLGENDGFTEIKDSVSDQ